MRPSSFPACFIIALTLASSVISQRKANARTPRADNSPTVCRASLADLRKVMATSAPAAAKASAEARPKRRAAPVTKAVFPSKSFDEASDMSQILPRHSGLRRRVHGEYRPVGTCAGKPSPYALEFTMPEPRSVVVYSRKGCHLCEVVKESLTPSSRAAAASPGRKLTSIPTMNCAGNTTTRSPSSSSTATRLSSTTWMSGSSCASWPARPATLVQHSRHPEREAHTAQGRASNIKLNGVCVALRNRAKPPARNNFLKPLFSGLCPQS